MGALVCLCFAGCGGTETGGSGERKVITVKGSDTMVILGQRWAEEYMNKTPGISIQVTGGGSGTGIAALINGATDICESSRPMKEKEKQDIRARHGKEVKEIPVALDGLAIYVHRSNPIQSITRAQLKSTYRGRLSNWRELGWENAQIVTYSRENNSGTYVFFKEHILDNEDFAENVQTLPGTAAIVNAVANDRRSIGYGGIAYSSGIRAVPVVGKEGGEAVSPSLETVQSGKYPLSRNLYFYTAGEPLGHIKEFINWVLSDEGQKTCDQVGYYPLKKQ
ncbi:MAG: phosphate-binding protein [Acidobacteria bacterium]|nr:MAG: phosphate-binding protein [Acidobacteriota bacterium]